MDAAALLRLISEPTKHAVLTSLRDGERSVSDLVGATGREQSNVSHHLRVLRERGLVRWRQAGRERHYRLADPEVRRLLEQVDRLADRLEQVAYSSGLGISLDSRFHGYG